MLSEPNPDDGVEENQLPEYSIREPLPQLPTKIGGAGAAADAHDTNRQPQEERQNPPRVEDERERAPAVLEPERPAAPEREHEHQQHQHPHHPAQPIQGRYSLFICLNGLFLLVVPELYSTFPIEARLE